MLGSGLRSGINCAAALIMVCMSTLPVHSNDIEEGLLGSLPAALEGWAVQTDSKETDAGGTKAFGMYRSPAEDRLFVIELDAGGHIVTTMAGAWDAMLLTTDVVEIGAFPFLSEQDGFTALIDGKILIRAYAPEGDERDAIKSHLDGLDIAALAALAAQLK